MFTRGITPASFVLCVTLAIGVSSEALAQERTLTVMTRNMDEGTDFGPIFAAATPGQLLSAVADAFLEVQASNIPERAAAIAREIEATHPDLVGLQEASLWRTGPFLNPPATTVAYDLLQSLLDALSARGLHYAPIASLANTDAEAPSALGFDVRFTNRDVLLARTDLPTAEFRLLNVQAQHFSTNLTFGSPTLGTVTILRGWITVDARMRDKVYRFITTHLESESSAIRSAQAQELIVAHTHTCLPVMLVGDLNSDAASTDPSQNEAYRALVGAGFNDAWKDLHPNDPGFTIPLHGEDPFTPFATPSRRIDLVLSRGTVAASSARLVGNELEDLTLSGLWPSDHAGVVVSFVLQPCHTDAPICKGDEGEDFDAR